MRSLRAQGWCRGGPGHRQGLPKLLRGRLLPPRGRVTPQVPIAGPALAHSELLDARRGRSGAVLEFHRQLTAWCAMLAMTTYTNAPIYRAVGLDPRRAAREAREARANPHFRRTMRWAGERLVAFLTDAGMITALQRPLWRRSLLLG
ncbi:diiron oxygenase [Streptomyces sp. NPDC056697]|uniref:diiron oxygenase n=1 Tax=Streptomyces sp. NPDC056697 TaxID=3345915 RepID=UPI0036B478B0